jgi:hypothetical protein
MGNFYDPKDGQMAIMGGTGELVSAHGVIKYKKVQETIGLDTYRQFNISAFYAPSTVSTLHAFVLFLAFIHEFSTCCVCMRQQEYGEKLIGSSSHRDNYPY